MIPDVGREASRFPSSKARHTPDFSFTATVGLGLQPEYVVFDSCYAGAQKYIR